MRRALWRLALIGWVCRALAGPPAALAQDENAALAAMPDQPGREEVFYTCNACHSGHGRYGCIASQKTGQEGERGCLLSLVTARRTSRPSK